MNADDYRAALKMLGLSQNAGARLLGVDARTSRRWACDECPVPGTVARFLNYLIASGTSGAAAMALLGV